MEMGRCLAWAVEVEKHEVLHEKKAQKGLLSAPESRLEICMVAKAHLLQIPHSPDDSGNQ